MRASRIETRKQDFPKDEAELQVFLRGCVRGPASVHYAYLEKLESWHRFGTGIRASFARTAFARVIRDRRAFTSVIESLRTRIATDNSEETIRTAVGVVLALGEGTPELASDLIRIAFTSGSIYLMELALEATRMIAGGNGAAIGPAALEILGAALTVPFANAAGEMVFTNDPRIVDWVTALLDALPENAQPAADAKERALVRAREHQLGHAPSTLKRSILQTIATFGALELAGLELLRAGIISMMGSKEECCDSVGKPVACRELALQLAHTHGLLDSVPLLREEVSLASYVVGQIGRLRRLALREG